MLIYVYDEKGSVSFQKEALQINKKFIHIHPGYLPEVRGADGSLWHINRFNNIGVTSFLMSEKIDDGLIIDRDRIEMPKFTLNDYNSIEIKTLYRLWYSFFDPLLRAWHLKKFINNNKLTFENINKKITNQDLKSEYFTFMDENVQKETFKKIFKF